MFPKERKILTILQSDFPFTAHPYQYIARRLGMREDALIRVIKALRTKGYIRRIGAVVASQKTGYKSVLVGACVEKKHLSTVTSRINRLPNVSHNYMRDDEFNIWFTLSAKTKEHITTLIRRLKKEKGIVRLIVLPAKKVFKINARFTV